MKKIVLFLVLAIFISGCVEKTTEEPEVKEIPSSIENNCMGFLIGNPKEETGTAVKIGAAWVRPHPGPFAWGKLEPKKGKFIFKESDMWIKEIQKNNMAILATIWPYADWDQEICHGDECKVTSEDGFYPKKILGKPVGPGIPISRCAPCNLDDYKNFVSKMVERYDGDGIDDMPDLQIPIKHWEVMNEPEIDEVFLSFFKGTQEEYIEILKASNEAIKSACSDCKVVQGGAASVMSNMLTLTYWRRIFDLGGADYFDIANIHYINEGDLNTLNVKDFKALMQEKNIIKPIWVTEAQYRSEDQVVKSVDGALNEGAEKIFFTQFKIGQFGVPPSREYSNVYDNLVEKCR